MRVATRSLLARLGTITAEIRSGRYPNARKLARQLEVNPRTILRDIDYLRDHCGAPIEYDAIRHGYYFKQANFTLPTLTMSEGELVAFVLGGLALKQFAGAPFATDLERAFARLAAHLPDEISVHAEQIVAALSVTPTASPALDPSVLRTLTRAVHNRQTIEFGYWAASRNQESVRTVNPYALRLIDGTLYVIGYCHTRRAIRTFAAQRIGALRTLDEYFERPANFCVEEFYRGTFRALRGTRSYRVELRFSPRVARRVQEKRWHASQRFIASDDGAVILQLELTDLREVLRWALSWGRECQVLRPRRLITMVEGELNAMRNVYNGNRRGASR
jgi:predicted DNA-binding transcriptional regulator YafY